MKIFITTLFFLTSLNSFAKTQKVDIISAEYGVEDHEQSKTLCLTIVRIPESGNLIGIVEDISDCYYARLAKKAHSSQMSMTLNDLRPIEYQPLKQYLEAIDTQLEFLFSDGE